MLCITACGPQLPAAFDESDRLPTIYPDYIGVTIPVNIAPLTFELDEDADEMIASYSLPATDGSHGASTAIVCQGKMQPSAGEWQALVTAAADAAIQVDVYARHGDRWTHYKPFSISVSPDSIDPWLSYRLIQPSYISYEALTISQRCLENYDERVIYDNMLCGKESEGQCINCHNYQQYNPGRMQFHARQNHGGTVIAYDGEVKKVDMRSDSILSAGVYPAWHPWLKLIVYSTDKTVQSFHTTDRNKVEVYDTASDLIVYDMERGTVANIENDPDEMEVFPAWAPDGKTLYYCSAHFVRNDSIENASTDVVSRIDSLRYTLYRKRFDPATKTFGPKEALHIACATDSTARTPGQASPARSAALPRISPDGRYLLFTVASHGYFHIWHHDADLWMADLQGGQDPTDSTATITARPLTEVNSDDTESYHSWSSNGRWIVFSSRRDDGVFTRLFFAHFDGKGHFSRPFELPSADPHYHRLFMRCYNIPELMHGPVTIAPQTFADILKGEAEKVKYSSSGL